MADTLLPQPTTNPVLSEIMNLSPSAKTALGMAGHTMPNPVPQMPPVQPPNVSVRPSLSSMVPQDAGPPPTVKPLQMPSSVPQLGAPQLPNVVAPRGTTQGDTNERGRLLDTGAGEDQIYHNITNSGFGQNHPIIGKLLGGLAEGAAKVGDIGLSAVAPEVAINTPGTEYHHQALLHQANSALAGDVANEEKEAQTKNLEIQPELRQAQQALNEERQHEVENKNTATEENNKGKLTASLAAHGFAVDETDPTGKTLRPLKYEEMSPTQQAAADLKGSQAELASARQAYVQAQKSNLPEQMRLAQARIAVAEKNADTAVQRLGLSTAEYGLNSDKYYNPQPTARERTTGDLATSAVNQVHTMRQIIKEHPDMFGPGGAAKQSFQRWLSSNAEDAGKFLAASNYLAEHSAGVFGGRGEYIIHNLQGMTNPNFDPSALNGVLDQAENTATHFVKAGQVHGKGEQGAASQEGNNAPEPVGTTNKPDGVYEMGGKQYRVEGGKVYAH